MPLKKGTYQYKFKYDGRWFHDPHKKHVIGKFGSKNNVINVIKHKKVELILNPLKPCEWTALKNIKLNAISGNSLNIIDDKLYIFGGKIHQNFRDSMYEINWEEKELALMGFIKGKPPGIRGNHQYFHNY